MDKSVNPTHAQQMVTDSRYFSQEFNTAIIDGPLRIYFSDRQEANALQVYFDIQESLSKGGMRLDTIPLDAASMFLMLYPSEESFKDIFNLEEKMAFGKFGKNLVFGINGPCAESTRKLICSQIKTIFSDAIHKLDIKESTP